MIIQLFPTLISKRAITTAWNREEILDVLENYFQKQLQTGIVDCTLHKSEIFKPVVDFMNSAVNKYWHELGYAEDYPIELSKLWANRFDKGMSYPIHNDSPAIISTVFYVQKDSAEMGNLYFGDPNEDLIRTHPLTDERREQLHQDMDLRTGELVCFPSWLHHGIKENTTDVPRYSLAGVYELKGQTAIRRMIKQ